MVFGIGAVVPNGQGVKQPGELGLACVLSSLIGLEREWRQKAAGLRTHTLVGDVKVTLEVVGQPSAQQLALELDDLDGVREVTVLDRAHSFE